MADFRSAGPSSGHLDSPYEFAPVLRLKSDLDGDRTDAQFDFLRRAACSPVGRPAGLPLALQVHESERHGLHVSEQIPLHGRVLESWIHHCPILAPQSVLL